jgi:hypothetical protein
MRKQFRLQPPRGKLNCQQVSAVNSYFTCLLSYFTFFSSGMATNSNDTSSVPQKAADAVFVPTQEHGFNNKVQGKMIPDLEMSLHTFRCVLFTVF